MLRLMLHLGLRRFGVPFGFMADRSFTSLDFLDDFTQHISPSCARIVTIRGTVRLRCYTNEILSFTQVFQSITIVI